MWQRFVTWLFALFAVARTRESGSSTTPAVASSTETEFSAEIVRVLEVRKHPNADRLEIATFEMAANPGVASSYEVVTGRGDFSPGKLAAYFSVDCIVPTSHPDFAFLTTRLDGAGKTHYRLRAARLRGVFSQGLLVRAPTDAAFGQQVAEQFGVTYHRAPEPEERMPTQPRRPAPQPIPVYAIDSLKKLPQLFTPDDYVHVTEKIHGTNFRFGWVPRKFLGINFGWKFVYGSHRVIKDGESTGFYKEDVWTEAARRMNLAERTRHYRGYVFYGELYGHTYSGQRIQDLTYGRRPEAGPGLAIFDIKRSTGTWISSPFRRALTGILGFEDVPTLYEGRLGALDVAELADGDSLIADHIREGCVVECDANLFGNEPPRRKAKYVGAGYLLRKEAA